MENEELKSLVAELASFSVEISDDVAFLLEHTLYVEPPQSSAGAQIAREKAAQIRRKQGAIRELLSRVLQSKGRS
jgi:hypothetical protein